MLGLSGCASFYSCVFEINSDKRDPDKVETLLIGLREISDQFGLQLYISDNGSVVYRKGPDQSLPPNFQHLQPTTKMEVTLAYHAETCRVILLQRDETDETPYVKSIRMKIMALLNGLFTQDGYRMDLGTRSKSPLA